MAACPRGHIAAYELLQKLLIITNHNLVSHARINLPSASPRSTRSVFQREAAVPVVTQYLTVTCAQLTYPICYVFTFLHPCALRDVIVDTDLK